MENEQLITMNLTLVHSYLQVRAKEEGVGFELTTSYIIEQFDIGTRNFFGIEVNEIGFPLWDDQEPTRGFLNMFISWFIIQ